MKILWITNILFPEAEKNLKQCGELRTSGGWMLASAENLLLIDDSIQLYVATVSILVSDLKIIKGDRIIYYVIPLGKGNTHINRDYDKYWKSIFDEIKPDVTHIHGTEFSHGFSYLKTCGNDNVLISIQGLTSVYYHYFNSGINSRTILRNITFIDLYSRSTIFQQKRAMALRGQYERLMLENVNHIIGRTSWDKAHTWAINPYAKYHFCNETLRREFYQGCWEYNKCIKHTIFISQSSTPIKGLYQLLKAMPLVLRHYPDTKIRIGGWNPTENNTLRQKIRLSGFGKILRQYIKKHSLDSSIYFLGNLNAEEMKSEFLSANVFVMPSSIENSPNSLGEAQLLGVPCVVAYVGGVHDMVPNSDCGILYRFDEIEMLAHSICDLFEKSKNFDNSQMRRIANERHDADNNAKTLFKIYNNIKKR